MAKIDSFNFGFIVVDEKQYVHDVLILPDGTVKKREVSRAREGSHSIIWSDIEKMVKEQPETIVIGTGTSGLARLSAEAEVNLQQANLNLMVLPSLQAVEKFNQLVDERKRVAALIHITC